MTDPTPPPDHISPPKMTQPITRGDKEAGEDSVRPFSSYMQQKGGEAHPLRPGENMLQASPFDLAQGKVPPPGPTFDTIQAQAKMAHATMGTLSEQLNSPNLKLKQSAKYLLKNKLTAAKGNILSASTKLGASTVEDEEPKGSGALATFLNLLTSGQKQLEATQQHVEQIAESGKTMNPGDMLLVQIKLNKAQQQLEYSSMLLGKAMDDINKMMNIQL